MTRDAVRQPDHVRIGFHRLGLLGLVALAVVAGLFFVAAAYVFATGRPTLTYVVTGPDGRHWEYTKDTGHSIEDRLSQFYGKRIVIGAGADLATIIHEREAAWTPAMGGLAA